jgi:hypothetical protein
MPFGLLDRVSTLLQLPLRRQGLNLSTSETSPAD